VPKKNTIKQIFKEHYQSFKQWALTNSYSSLRQTVDDNIEKIIYCKDPKKLGFHQYSCPNHPDNKTIIPHTCKSRSCTSCGSLATNRWADSINDSFPNKPYFHITFTLPPLISHFFAFKRKLFRLLFKATADTMLSWFWEKHKVTPAISTVIHTFGRQLNWHVHIHMIISAGGFVPSKGIRSIDSSQDYSWKNIEFIPYKMIAKRFRYLLTSSLTSELLDARYSQKVIDVLHETNWYTHCSGKLDKTIVTIGYIGRYTKRPPIAESKVLDYDGEFVTFRFTETRSKTDVIDRCPVDQFIKRFVQHIPEKHQKYIMHYGLMANRCKTFYQRQLFSLGLLFDKTKARLSEMKYRLRKMIERGFDPMVCEKCGAEMILDAVVVKVSNGLTVKFIRSNQVSLE